MPTHPERLQSARNVLEGLSVGDAIGEALSYRHYEAFENADFDAFRDGTVRYTDDTEMACAVLETLSLLHAIDEDAIAWAFAKRYKIDPDRGYGKGARKILTEISLGADWRSASMGAFGGGSFGNGAAMRVAPIGAYFAGDIEKIVEMATRSARVTHYHPEGIAGAVAVALATGAAVSNRNDEPVKASEAVWQTTVEFTPNSRVKDGIEEARKLQSLSTFKAASLLGNGADISAQDTVPFCIWNACRNISNYREAILSTIQVGGDCDTNCAIAGAIVTGFAGTNKIPPHWLRVPEPLRLQFPEPSTSPSALLSDPSQ